MSLRSAICIEKLIGAVSSVMSATTFVIVSEENSSLEFSYMLFTACIRNGYDVRLYVHDIRFIDYLDSLSVDSRFYISFDKFSNLKNVLMVYINLDESSSITKFNVSHKLKKGEIFIDCNKCTQASTVANNLLGGEKHTFHHNCQWKDNTCYLNLSDFCVTININYDTIHKTSQELERLQADFKVCLLTIQPYLDIYAGVIYPSICPTPIPMSQGKIILSPTNGSLPTASASNIGSCLPSMSGVTVWTDNLASEGYDYLIATMRHSYCCPDMLMEMCPAIRQKVPYFRDCAPIHRSLELIELVLLSYQYVCAKYIASLYLYHLQSQSGGGMVDLIQAGEGVDAVYCKVDRVRETLPSQLDFLCRFTVEVCGLFFALGFTLQCAEVAARTVQLTSDVLDSTSDCVSNWQSRVLVWVARGSSACGLVEEALAAYQAVIDCCGDDSLSAELCAEASAALLKLESAQSPGGSITGITKQEEEAIHVPEVREVITDSAASSGVGSDSCTSAVGLVVGGRSTEGATSAFGDKAANGTKERWRLLQKQAPLSESEIYRMLQRFYVDKGLDAWGGIETETAAAAIENIKQKDIVPQFATSNCVICNAYASTFFGCLWDCYVRDALDPYQPTYIIELGAGHGKFSILFLRQLSRLLSQARQTGHPIGQSVLVLVFTDFTSDNFPFIESSVDIQPFLFPRQTSAPAAAVTPGVYIDFAVLDCCSAHPMQLQRSGSVIGDGPGQQCRNPVFVIANYIFDSLAMDSFKVGDNGQLLEGLLTIEYGGNIEDIGTLTSLDLPDCRLLWEFREALDGVNFYPGDPRLTSVLQEAVAYLSPGSCFTVPIGGIRCLDRLRQFSKSGTMMALVADKALNRLDMISGSCLAGPTIAVHGSLSLTVNMHALGLVYSSKDMRNSFMHTPQRYSPIDVCFIRTNFETATNGVTGIEQAVETDSAGSLSQLLFMESLCRVGLMDVFTIRDNCENVFNTRARHAEKQKNSVSNALQLCVSLPPFPIAFVAALGRASHWDPDIFEQFEGVISAAVAEKFSTDLVHADSSEAIYSSPAIATAALQDIISHRDRYLEGLVSYFDVGRKLSQSIENLNI